MASFGGPAAGVDSKSSSTDLLLLAEEDARLGDYRQALHALNAAAALCGGVLPEAWVRNRSRRRELAHAG